MANQIPIKVMCDGSGNTCGLAQFTSSDSVAIAAGGTGLTSQGICEFVQPGLYAVGCQVTYLGICAGKADTGVGYDNTYVGHSAGTAATTACRHTIIGSQAGKAITTCSGTVAIGYNAAVAQTFGDFNTYVGTAAGAAVTTASNNTIIGYHAATATICSNNIVIGTCAMVANTQGQDNVAIGLKAGATQVAAGCNNVFVGSCVGAVALCRDNTIVGAKAGIAQTTGVKNVFLGACVGYGVQGGSNNVYVGDQAGLVNTSGNANVFIGNCAGAASTASCVLIIGNGASDLVVGCFASGIIKINNAYCLPAADGSASQFLCTDGSGALAFATLVSSPWSTSGCFITTPSGCYVGIGTSSPSSLLHIKGAGETQAYIESATDTNAGIRLLENGANKWTIANSYSDDSLFMYSFTKSGGAAKVVTISADGDVGIGTTSPDQLLHIEESSAGDKEMQFQIENTGIGDAAMTYKIAAQSWSMGVDNNEADRFVISSSGNLEDNPRMVITSSGYGSFGDASGPSGTGGANQVFSINSTCTSVDFETWRRSDSISDEQQIGLWMAVTGATTPCQVAGIGYFAEGTSENQANMRFYTSLAGTNTERMRITSCGAVGIGVDGTATDSKLHVNGAISFGMGNTSTTTENNKLFGFYGSLVADNTARTLLQQITGGVGAGYFVTGMARDSATGFVDIIVTSAGGLGVVSSTTTKGTPGARSYTVVSENIKLAINDSSCIYCISISGLGTNDLGNGVTPTIGA